MPHNPRGVSLSEQSTVQCVCVSTVLGYSSIREKESGHASHQVCRGGRRVSAAVFVLSFKSTLTCTKCVCGAVGERSRAGERMYSSAGETGEPRKANGLTITPTEVVNISAYSTQF